MKLGLNRFFPFCLLVAILTSCPKNRPPEEELPWVAPYTKEELEEMRKRRKSQPKRKEQLQANEE